MVKNEELWKKIERGVVNLTPNCQLNFAVHIVEHCNLNCTECNHYSPLAEEEFLDINSFEKDCSRLSELFDGEMCAIFLMGGEPLLHPQITEFMRVARKAFPIGKVALVTNGLLLRDMPEDFWEACKKYDVIIEHTCYPIKLDYDELEKITDSKGVKYNQFDRFHHTQFKRYPICDPLLGEHSSLSTRNFLSCRLASNSEQLRNGKLYPCPQAAYASHLKKYFDLNLHLSEKDGVDIYSVKSGDELLEKLSRPIPFCRYCDVTDELIASDWKASRRDRYEWLAFSFTAEDVQYLKSKAPVVYMFGAGRWGEQTAAFLKNKGIAVKSMLSTRKKAIDNIQGIPIVTLDELGKVEPDSICLVALGKRSDKEEVYPLLSKIGFGDVVPVCGLI